MTWETAKEILSLGPGRFAVEDFDKMREAIPGFEKIYEGRSPQVFKILGETSEFIKVAEKEWHKKDHYRILEIRL